MNSTNKRIKERLTKLPSKPGVYFFKDKKGKIIEDIVEARVKGSPNTSPANEIDFMLCFPAEKT